MVIAEYHANAIIGLLRREHTPSFEFFAKLVVAQIIPVLENVDPEFGEKWIRLVHNLPTI
jgi:hypothetical protein